jgi:S-DNA-T family DNA segregation ATPase FtsK/SpoIIIE
VSTRTRSAPARKDAAKRKQKRNDGAAIVLFASGVIVLAGLLLADRGVVGQAAADFFRMMFGVGAWLVPPLLFIFAGAVAFGRRLRLSSLFWGLILTVVSVLGLAAKYRGDWFDPEMVMAGGGYIGAALAMAMHFCFGVAGPVAIGAIGALGIVTATNYPIFHVLEGKFTALTTWWRDRSRKRKVLKQTGKAVVKLPTKPVVEEEPVAEKPKPVVQKAPKPTPANLEGQQREGYVLPPLRILHDPPVANKSTVAEVGKKIEVLERTMEEFGIEADVVEVAQGPTVTRYEIQLGPGIKVSKIVSLADNLAMSLAAIGLRVEAPIPGKSAIGVEVPNDNPATVGLKEILAHKEIMDLPDRLILALGRDVSGHARYANLAKMPHLLMGGATNSGKSVGLSAMISSLLMRNTPKDVRLVLIDPKRVELTLFDGVPHLMCPVVKEVKKAAGIFKSILAEMDKRYDILSEAQAKNIESYNAKVSYNQRMPFIVVVVDELADLMMQQGAEVEYCICRLAQLARATGIHLLLATQRPSVDVITGTIKANISSRIGFAVTSAIDSRTILDQTGADRLIGRGDMLYLPIDAPKPTRIQGCYISEADIAAIVEHWKQQEAPEYTITPAAIEGGGGRKAGSDDGEDALYLDAVRLVVSNGQASTSLLQRKFKIGYQRAARLIDIMEMRGVVGPLDGPRPREILISQSEWAELYGREL